MFIHINIQNFRFHLQNRQFIREARGHYFCFGFHQWWWFLSKQIWIFGLMLEQQVVLMPYLSYTQIINIQNESSYMNWWLNQNFKQKHFQRMCKRSKRELISTHNLVFVHMFKDGKCRPWTGQYCLHVAFMNEFLLFLYIVPVFAIRLLKSNVGAILKIYGFFCLFLPYKTHTR